MRNDIVKKYLEKYSLGVVEIENSIEQYESFFKNMGFDKTIDEMISEKVKDKVFVKIMDLGCGDAGFLIDLKNKFDEAIHTIGVDLLVPTNKPDEMILGDALEAEFPKDVDFIFSFRALHEIGEPEKMVEKIHDSLAEGGKAFLSFRTMDLYMGKEGIAEISAKEVKTLSKMVSKGKLNNFSIKGFEASVKTHEGKNLIAGVNIFLEK